MVGVMSHSRRASMERRVMVRGRERGRMGSMSLPSSLFLLLEHMWELQGPFINDISREGKGLAKF